MARTIYFDNEKNAYCEECAAGKANAEIKNLIPAKDYRDDYPVECCMCQFPTGNPVTNKGFEYVLTEVIDYFCGVNVNNKKYIQMLIRYYPVSIDSLMYYGETATERWKKEMGEFCG